MDGKVYIINTSKEKGIVKLTSAGARETIKFLIEDEGMKKGEIFLYEAIRLEIDTSVNVSIKFPENVKNYLDSKKTD